MTPPGPVIVAVRTSLVLAIALTFQLGIAPRFLLFGVQGDLMLLVGIAAALWPALRLIRTSALDALRHIG